MKDPARHDRALVVAVAGIVAAGIALRFVQRSDLWLDEALTVNIARLSLGDITEALRHDGHPPLYYVVLHGWMSLFGEGDGAVRALSGAFSVATLPLAWIAGRRRGGQPMAVAALVVVATSPYAIRYGAEARMYSLVMLLVFAGWLFLDDALRAPTVRRLTAVAVTSGLLLLAHYWSMWLLGAVGLVLLVRARWGPVDQRRASLRCAVATAAGAVLFVPWVPVLLHQAGSTGTPWAGPVRPTSAVAVTLTDLAGPDIVDTQLLAALLVVLFLLGLFGAARDERVIELDLRTRPVVRAEAIVVSLTLGIGLLASYASATTYVSRYAAVFVPPVLVVVAAGLACVVGRGARIVAFAVVAGLGLAGSVVLAVDKPRTQAGAVAAAITADGAASGDLVVYCPDQLGPAVDRLLPSSLTGLAYPALGDPTLVDWEDYASRSAAADPDAITGDLLQRAGTHRIYLVWSTSYETFEGQCEALVAGLGRARPGAESLVAADDDYFEPASLTRFP